MDDPTEVTLVAALVGALVGGLASAVGSWWLERQRLIRAERTRLYRDLLPQVRKRKSERASTAIQISPAEVQVLEGAAADLTDELRRAALLAGPRAAKLAHQVQTAWLKRDGSPTMEDEEGNPLPTAEWGAADDHFTRTIEALDRHLERKLQRRI